MARELHVWCTTDDVQKDLRKKYYKILAAINIMEKEKQEINEGNKSLPSMDSGFDNKKTILDMVVNIETLKKNSIIIPQCKRCQEFNHAEAYCWKELRCVPFYKAIISQLYVRRYTIYHITHP